MAKLTYRDAGVDMDAGDALVEAIKPIARSTNRPGVLAEIAGVLGKHQISIASVIQHEPSGDGAGRIVPLVIMTYQAKEGAAQAAMAEIDRLKCVRQGSVRMRVLD